MYDDEAFPTDIIDKGYLGVGWAFLNRRLLEDGF